MGVFNHLWSLAIEEQYYLVWPLVIWLTTRRQAQWLCVGLIGLALGSRVFFGIYLGNVVAAEALTLCRCDSLAIGSFLALVTRETNGKTFAVKCAWWIAVPASGLLLVVVGVGKGFFYLPVTLLALVCGGLLVWALTATDVLSRWLWQNRLLIFFGKYSYALYLFQNFLVPYAQRFWPVEKLTPTVGEWVGPLAHVFISGAITVLSAWCSWHLYEKHWLKLKERVT